MTDKKVSASQRNGSQSRGPVTAKGKAVSSQNARKHGILSRELILPDEKAEEFQALFNQLQEELRPLGTLENTLVERIAIAIWRQRRLVRAETSKTLLWQCFPEMSGSKEGSEVQQLIINIYKKYTKPEDRLDELKSQPVPEDESNAQGLSRLISDSKLLPENADQLSRYQSALDNELYKAMRALREAQAWRLKTIEGANS